MSIDIESFLNPISEDKPCGENLYYEPIYDELKELRREDDPSLSQGVWQTELKKANWSTFISKSENILKTKTKDLQIAMWLMDAWLVERRFEGLNDGLKLIKGLVDKFWDDIYPPINKDDSSFRLAPFYFLSDKILERLVLVPLTTPDDAIVYSLSDWLEARRNLQINNFDGISLVTINKQVAITPTECFQNILNQVNEAIGLLTDLGNFMDGKYSTAEVPSFINLIEHLKDIKLITEKNLEFKTKQDLIRKQKEEKAAAAAAAAAAAKNQANVDNIELDDEPQSKEPTLEQAYTAMKEISIFLDKKQPQSPAAILVKLALILGKKSFKEILDLSMKQEASILNAISELYIMINKKPPEPSTSQEEEPFAPPPPPHSEH